MSVSSRADLCLGIDIGSSKIVISTCENNKANILLTKNGDRATPFCIAFNEKERIFAQVADYQATINPANTIFGRDVFSVIGKKNHEIGNNCMQQPSFVPIKVEQTQAKSEIMFCVNYKDSLIHITPEQALSMVLTKAIEHLKSDFDQRNVSAVVTVPSMFNSSQRHAIKNACTAAGVEVLGLLNNAMASAITYNLERSNAEDKNILIFDMGATSLDVGIFETRGNKVITKGLAGDLNIGGENFVEVLVAHFLDDFHTKNGIYIEDMSAIKRIRNASEKIKKILSTSKEANETIDTFYHGNPYKMEITRETFEERCSFLFETIQKNVESVINQSGLSINEINEFIIVGGGGRIPKVQNILKEMFNGKELSKVLNQDESIALGAAYLARSKMNPNSYKVRKLEVQNMACMPLLTGIDNSGWIPLVKTASLLPQSKDLEWMPTINGTQLRFWQGCHALNEIQTGEAIQLFFNIDSNGLVDITAKSCFSKITLKLVNHTKIDQEKIINLKNQEKMFQRDDKELKLIKELQNDLEGCCRKYKRMIETPDMKDCINEENKKMVIDHCTKLLSWLENTSIFKVAELEKFQQKLDRECVPIINRAKKNLEWKKLKEQAENYQNNQKYKEANGYYDKLISSLENDDSNESHTYDINWCHKQKSIVLFKLGQYGQAISSCDYVVNLDECSKDTLDALKIRAQCYFHLERFNDCMIDSQNVLSRAKDDKILELYEKSKQLIVKRQIEQTLQIFFEHFQKKKYDEAVEVCNSVLNAAPNPKNPEKYESLIAKVYFNRGKAFYESKRYVEAIDDFSFASNSTELLLKALELRGECYVKLEEYEKAVADFETVQNDSSDSTSKHLSKQIDYAKKMIETRNVSELFTKCKDFLDKKCYQEAINLLQQKESKNLDKISKLKLLTYQMYAYYEIEKFDDVLKTSETALNIDKRHEFSHCMRAVAFVNKEDFNKAVQSCDAAIKVNKGVAYVEFKEMINQHSKEKVGWKNWISSFFTSSTNHAVEPKIKSSPSVEHTKASKQKINEKSKAETHKIQNVTPKNKNKKKTKKRK